MKLPTLKLSTVAISVAIVALAAIYTVQHSAVPPMLETVTRSFMHALGLLAVPILIVVAFRAWAKVTRPELPRWRNGLGLASMAIISATWLFHVLLILVLLILESLQPCLTRPFHIEWLWVAPFWSSFAAALLAIALRGASRTEVIAAALSM